MYSSKGERKALTYICCTQSEIKRRYSQLEKEALAVVYARERLHVFIYGTEFDLVMGYKPLAALIHLISKMTTYIYTSGKTEFTSKTVPL